MRGEGNSKEDLQISTFLYFYLQISIIIYFYLQISTFINNIFHSLLFEFIGAEFLLQSPIRDDFWKILLLKSNDFVKYYIGEVQ